MLVQLLSRGTNMQVIEAVHGSNLSLNKVYITPPDKEISIVGGLIHLKKPAFAAGPKPSVDVLFQSMATEFKSKAIAIVLSGTGSDGAAGVTLIKKAGGFVIVQDPQTGKYDGMPSAAIETGNVDIVLPPDKMGEIIKDYINSPETVLNRVEETAASSTTLDKIFKLLSKRTGTDFSNYKPSTICRRLEKRLNMLQLSSIEDYLPIVEKNPKELDIMFNMILIGVTAFFRDLAAFEALEKQLAQIIENKGNKAPIRIWIPGCSTGEEAYSVAILLSKLLKEKTLLHNIQIFATDIDDRAISFARRALYPETSLEEVPKETIDTYFIKKGREYELVKSIRMMVLFSKHDVTKNPPFLKLDLISCRNLLIYFGANLQKQVLPIFHYALNPNGYLFLGKSETIGQFSDLFAVIDDKLKIYQRKAVGNIHGIKFSAFKTQRQNLPE
ncbi:MAG: CheR family methyltransferase, partial [Chitinophagaceae bacterium]